MTIVYASKEPRLVKEFQELFNALREEFSRPLELSRPGLFHNEPQQCDILASFLKLPEGGIVAQDPRIWTGDWPRDDQSQSRSTAVKRDDAYRPNKPHIKICVSALKFLDTKRLKDELKRALHRGVQISVALWAPGPFTEARARVIGLDAEDVEREMDGSWSVAKFLGKHENLFIRRCTSEFGSVSIIWIDELIYFSTYWLGKDVADGPHFLTLASSDTGRQLQDQYEQMLEDSTLEN